ncbi:carbohydrate ABC transporter permease [Tessaracoccus defluvii]|uniref:Carbohydrate ABC transporter permease n=1 Tax=Tessaracoccus defluvii TaxID=1285901 RepID=A0A7H0H4H7_9ACTN|nr:carbohydrate ABC transporter permease [Tessaracoccus defluvii]QNP55443.1 carbohydrate ABC transporter permease [Tessaracoccus defluvii]
MTALSTRAVQPPDTVTPRRKRDRQVGIYVLAVILAAIFLGPFLWLVLAAFKTPAEWAALPMQILPEQINWDNFVSAVTQADFLKYLRNSLFLATIFATLTTLSSATVGFGFARLRAPGKKAMFVVLLATMMLPQILTLLPTYILFSQLGLINTYWPWVLWGLASSAYFVFLFRQFFSSIPRELEDAAIIDGCGWGRMFFTIFLPLSKPMLITVFLLSFMGSWGDYIGPALFLDQQKTTLAVAVTASYVDPAGNALPTVQAAASVLYIIPVLVIFFVFQRYFVRSSIGSGLKG